jgi:hypothetical protein
MNALTAQTRERATSIQRPVHRTAELGRPPSRQKLRQMVSILDLAALVTDQPDRFRAKLGELYDSALPGPPRRCGVIEPRQVPGAECVPS